MLYDPKDYPNPEKFHPDRFLKDGRIDKAVRNPADMAFGFGRRYAVLIIVKSARLIPNLCQIALAFVPAAI